MEEKLLPLPLYESKAAHPPLAVCHTNTAPGEDQLCVPIAFGIKKKKISLCAKRESMCHLLARYVWDFIIIRITVAYYSSADWTSFKVNKNVLANCYFESD